MRCVAYPSLKTDLVPKKKDKIFQKKIEFRTDLNRYYSRFQNSL